MLIEDEAKRKRERQGSGGGPKFQPHKLKFSQSCVNTKKKKKKKKKKKIFFKVSSIFQDPNFQLKNFHFQAFNFTFSMPKF